VAVVRLGTCSWADEGLLKNWYPRKVSTAERDFAHYAERLRHSRGRLAVLPPPDAGDRRAWAERTPEGFVFHAKASKEMTGHEETDSREHAFAQFRESLAPLEASGKLRGVLLQFHPRVKKSPEALDELRDVRELLTPLVPLIEFRHRSWMTEEERGDTLAFLEQHGLAYVSVDSPRTRASNVLPRIAAATHEVAYIRFHGRNWKTWNKKTKTSGERFDWLYSAEELEDWVSHRQPRRGVPRGVCDVSTTTASTTRREARRSCAFARRGGVERPAASSRRSRTLGSSDAGFSRSCTSLWFAAELYGDIVRADGHELVERSVVDDPDALAPADGYDAVPRRRRLR
jgi:uncharacterized protein YecE (DUF72 family)